MRVTGYDQTIAEISRVKRRVTRKKILFQIRERMVYSSMEGKKAIFHKLCNKMRVRA